MASKSFLTFKKKPLGIEAVSVFYSLEFIAGYPSSRSISCLLFFPNPPFPSFLPLKVAPFVPRFSCKSFISLIATL